METTFSQVKNEIRVLEVNDRFFIFLDTILGEDEAMSEKIPRKAILLPRSCELDFINELHELYSASIGIVLIISNCHCTIYHFFGYGKIPYLTEQIRFYFLDPGFYGMGSIVIALVRPLVRLFFCL